MQYALEQGDGILVVTGRSGTGKTTLADSLGKLKPGRMLIATLATTGFGTDDLLRMVAYQLGLEAKGFDRATLQRELEALLRRQTRTLLIIDEAQNLSAAALEEVRMLTNMRVGSRPLLQIFLFGQQQLRDRIHTPEMEQLHQRLTATCILEPLSLQETHDYVQHCLICAGWRGNPAITTDSFILINRFSQGLPRYINKLCNRLFLRGSVEQRSQLDMDDVVTVIEEIQDELLLPLPDTTHVGACEALPPIQGLVDSRARPIAQRMKLTKEEQVFLKSNPAVIKAPPAPVSAPAPKPAPIPAVRRRVGAAMAVTGSAPARSRVVYLEVASARRRAIKAIEAIKAIDLSPYLERLVSMYRSFVHKSLIGYSAVALVILVGAYQLDSHIVGQQKASVQKVASVSVPEPSALASRPERQAVKSPPEADFEIEVTTPLSTKSDSPHKMMSASADSDPLDVIDTIQPLPDVADQVLLTSFEGDAELDIKTVLTTLSIDAITIPIEPRVAAIDKSPELTAQVVRQIKDEKIQKLLQQGEQAIIEDRLRFPKERNAWVYYRQVLELDPNNQVAGHGLERIAARYAELTISAIQKQQYDKAQQFIRRGLGVVRGYEELVVLQLDVDVGQAELLAMQEREELLAVQKTETISLSPAVQSQPASRGFFGAVKKFFVGDKARESIQ